MDFLTFETKNAIFVSLCFQWLTAIEIGDTALYRQQAAEKAFFQPPVNVRLNIRYL